VNVNSSTSVFIPGGSGGVGHFSVQIARIQGAKQIITTASKEDGIKILKEKYQIKDVINHATENVVARVLELTHGQGADVVYDSTYFEANFAKSIPTVKEGGSWIVLGHFAQEGSTEAKSVAERKAKLVHADLVPHWVGAEKTPLKPFVQNTLIQGAKWIQEGKLKPYINQIIKLEEVENALGRLKQGKGGFGKIVVKLL
jgi:NADPH:quinone reductase-like Zn-dependent oxidoreductase